MSTVPHHHAPHSPSLPSFRTPLATSARRRTGLTGATVALLLAGPGACADRGGELATGIAVSRPATNVIPTDNTSTLEVRIRSPQNGATVSGTVSVEVEVKEHDVDRARGDLFIGDQLVASSTSERFTYSWSTSGDSGTQTITAVGWDAEGNSAVASISVTVPTSSTEPAPAEPVAQSVSLDPDSVVAGAASTGTVVLDAPAPAGGTTVALVSSKTTVATVPSSVTVPESATSTTFGVTSHPVATADWAAISANAGGVTQTAVLWVLPAGVTMDSLGLSPTTVASGETSMGTVRLSGAAPDGGASVALASGNTAVATVPPSVTVAAGATTATFAVTAQTVASNSSVSISASYGGVTRSASLIVAPPPPGEGELASLTVSPDLVVGGEPAQGTVTLGAASATGTEVALSSTDLTVATVPPSVTVPAGATSVGFTVTTLVNNTGAGQFSVISGAAGGVTRSATITTTPPPSGPAISFVDLFPSSVGGGGPVTGIVTFDAPLTDGVILSFTSSHPGVVQVPPEGVQVIWSSTERAFPVTTSPVSANTVVTITATACCGGVGRARGTLTVTTDPPPPPDRVEVEDARWIPGGRGGTLEVRARSSSQTAILTVFRAGTDIRLMVLTHVGGGKYEGEQSFGGGATNPGTIDVRSNLGGTATSEVRQ